MASVFPWLVSNEQFTAKVSATARRRAITAARGLGKSPTVAAARISDAETQLSPKAIRVTGVRRFMSLACFAKKVFKLTAFRQ